MNVLGTIEEIIKKLENNDITTFDQIPEDYQNDINIINITRNLGIRRFDKRGFDVISNQFFVEEIILESTPKNETIEKTITTKFNDFDSYFHFLQGAIYENACYYQFDFTKEIISNYNIDINKINYHSTLSYTIDDILPEATKEEIELYQETKKQLSSRKKWIEKYNACSTYNEFLSLSKKHKKSKDDTDERFYLWNYINHHGKNSFKVIMSLVCNGHYLLPENALFFLYDKKKVLNAYNYKAGVASTQKKHNSNFKKTAKHLSDVGYTCKINGGFDKKSHYFYVVTTVYLKESSIWPFTWLYKYFETFEEFTSYLNNDLSNCDLSNALDLKIDVSKYKTNENTKLPLCNHVNFRKVVKKFYNRKTSKFDIYIKWYDEQKKEIYSKCFSFSYFFDFVSFLKNDLSNANLLFCDGFKNLSDTSDLNLTNTILRSSFCKQLGLPSTQCNLPTKKPVDFLELHKNEQETALALNTINLSGFEKERNEQEIYYVTDLHLNHRIANANCFSHYDCVYVIQSIVDNLLENTHYGSTILLGGDIAADFSTFELFVDILRFSNQKDCKIVFTLGNHELWAFEDGSLDNTYKKYQEVILNHGMYLLNNNILYTTDNSNKLFGISQTALENCSNEEIRSLLRKANLVLYGGIGFSGYNQEFNAHNGVYRSALSREQEICETKQFEKLYDKIVRSVYDKNTIIVTHMPFEDWHLDKTRQKKFIYVNGHNHRNEFYDDGVIRLYADNQIGYNCESPKLKFFYIDKSYDWFSDYEDGIHLITKDDYINFYRGKNITLTCNREFNKLYMLKKNNYYCFIHQNTSGELSILNGGAKKRLSNSDIQYYYDNMDYVISSIEAPLNKYKAIQKSISKTVQEFGGSGTIHGAIIDIDFNNHIYVNPNDLTVTPYYALNIICKFVYPNVSSLLESKAPLLYSNYAKLLKNESNNILALMKSNNNLITEPQLYLSTDIYSASRVIKKMQKLDSNILSIWNDNIEDNKLLLP